jgi:hypothetical protein
MGKPVLVMSMDRASLRCLIQLNLNQSYVYTQILARVRVNTKQYINRLSTTLQYTSNIIPRYRDTRNKIKQTKVHYYAVGGRKIYALLQSAICIGINKSSKQAVGQAVNHHHTRLLRSSPYGEPRKLARAIPQPWSQDEPGS